MRCTFIASAIIILCSSAMANPVPTEKPAPPEEAKALIQQACQRWQHANSADYYQSEDAYDAHYHQPTQLDVSEIIIPLNITLSHYVESPIPLDESPIQLGTMRLSSNGQLLINEEPISDEEKQELCGTISEKKSGVTFGTVPAMKKQGIPALNTQ